MTVKISNSQLLELNKQGLIPGPDENTYDFLSRVKQLLYFSNQIEEFLSDPDANIPFEVQDKIPPHQKTKSLLLTEQLYDISPNWMQGFYSNHSLALWHAGCAWISPKSSPPKVYLQLRNTFKTSSRYLWIYKRDEILAHELSHIGRMSFNEPIFEEILAYKTSHSSIRRWIGPSIDSPQEAFIFTLSIAIIVFLDYLLLFLQKFSIYLMAMSLKFIPLAMLAIVFWRNKKRQQTFSLCLHNLEKICSSKSNALAVLYRLTDKEIYRFSKTLPQTILQYVNEEKKHSLRWRLLALAYFYPQ